MRIIIGAVLGGMVLAAAALVAVPGAVPPGGVPADGAAPGGVPAGGAAAGDAATPAEETGVVTEELKFDIFADNQKVGHMVLKIMTASDLVILDEEFVAPFMNRETAIEAKIVYRGTGKPVPQNAKVVTRFGQVNLMSGTITFNATPTGLTAKQEITGFADKERRPLTKAVVANKEAVVPAGLVLTYPAFIYYAPRLLVQAGQFDKIVYTELPGGVDFPAVIKFNADVVLTRSPEDLTGRTEFAIKRILAGGNTVMITTMITDKDGRIVESRVGKYTLRPASAESATPKTPKTPKTPATK